MRFDVSLLVKRGWFFDDRWNELRVEDLATRKMIATVLERK